MKFQVVVIVVVVMVVMMIFAVIMMPQHTRAVNIHDVRRVAAQHNVTSILVFGDSSVDPGNNNHLNTTFKGNFLPYRKDFLNGRPTGRFSNGRLATDFIVEALGSTRLVLGFLDPNFRKEALIHGVSFASAASGYDDLTATFSNVLPIYKQLEYFRHYKIHLRALVGEKRAEDIIKGAIFVLSMGTYDFIQNYFWEPTRSKQYSVDGYENYLASCMLNDIKEMHREGARRLVVVGVPPLGCMPLVKTLMGATECVDSYNKPSFSLNSKIKAHIANLKKSLGMKIAFADAYVIIEDAIKSPAKYGFTESSKGCCGSGTVEFGDTCRGLETCKDPSKYVFWDAVHPTEEMYKLMAEDVLNSVESEIL